MKRNNQRRISPEARQVKRQRLIRRLAKVLLSSSLLAGFVVIGWWLNQAMSVRQWDIEADAVLASAIESQLRAMPEKDFLHTRPAHLRRQWLADIPDMADVQITRILPDALHIEARLRLPVALWQQEQGIYLLDRHGHAYRPLRRGESPDMPLLRVEAERLASACHLLDMLRLAGKRESLSEIRSAGGHWRVYFTRGERWLLPQGAEETVIHRLTRILKKPRWQNRHWRVDARSPTRWFIRPARQGGVI